jgi:hypothetical protein
LFKIQHTMAKVQEVSVLEYIEKHNTVLTRRGHKMGYSYIYRLIREHEAGKNTRPLWFKYKFNGDKDLISIII